MAENTGISIETTGKEAEVSKIVKLSVIMLCAAFALALIAQPVFAQEKRAAKRQGNPERMAKENEQLKKQLKAEHAKYERLTEQLKALREQMGELRKMYREKGVKPAPKKKPDAKKAPQKKRPDVKKKPDGKKRPPVKKAAPKDRAPKKPKRPQPPKKQQRDAARKPAGNLEAIGRRLKAAVEAGKMTKQEAAKKLAAYKKQAASGKRDRKPQPPKQQSDALRKREQMRRGQMDRRGMPQRGQFRRGQMDRREMPQRGQRSRLSNETVQKRIQALRQRMAEDPALRARVARHPEIMKRLQGGTGQPGRQYGRAPEGRRMRPDARKQRKAQKAPVRQQPQRPKARQGQTPKIEPQMLNRLKEQLKKEILTELKKYLDGYFKRLQRK